MSKAKAETRWHHVGKLDGYAVVLMASADGYMMVRHKGCIPFVITQAEWDKLEREPPPNIKAINERERHERDKR